MKENPANIKVLKGNTHTDLGDTDVGVIKLPAVWGIWDDSLVGG